MFLFGSSIVVFICFRCIASATIQRTKDTNNTKDIFAVPYGTYGVGPNFDEIGEHFQGDIRGVTVNKWNFSSTRNVIRNQTIKWPNAEVPYIIDLFQFNADDAKLIEATMQEFHRFTCVRFVPFTMQIDVLYITADSGCSSHVGRRGFLQKLSLEIPGCLVKGIILHELMHVLGVWHEHSRSDRDKYIEINWSNIAADRHHNFQKLNDDQSQTFNISYDYGSIMHYSPYSFAVNRSIPTIVPVKMADGVIIGQRFNLSQSDIDKINILYECNKNTPSTSQPFQFPFQ